MFNELSKTLFIIGAGAHVPYDMPTGNQLRTDIKSLHSPYPGSSNTRAKIDSHGVKSNILKVMNQYGVLESTAKNLGRRLGYDTNTKEQNEQFLKDFITSFSESHVLSIDTYLSSLGKEKDDYKREVFKILGKVIIATLIAQYERQTSLGQRNDDWIHFFIDQFIRKDPEKFLSLSPKILTFNYDRVFERMIYTHLTEFHKYHVLTAKKYVDDLNIHHIYGSLGECTEWHIDDRLSLDMIYQSTKLMKTMYEDRKNESTAQYLKLHFREIKNIYFLGYGFDEGNNIYLKNSFPDYGWTNDRKIYSTTVGLKRSQLYTIEKTFGTTEMIRLNSHSIETINCTDLLFETAPLQLS